MIVKLKISKSQFESLITEEYNYGKQGLFVNIYQKRLREITMLDILSNYIGGVVGNKLYNKLRAWKTKLEKILPEEIKKASISIYEVEYNPQTLEVISIEKEG